MASRWVAILGCCAALVGSRAVLAQRLTVEIDKTQVGQYQKVELTIRVDRRYANPFDPDEVDLSVEVATPSGRTLTIPAFSYQAFEERQLSAGRRQTVWRYPAGMPTWKARLAPQETGDYRCRARLQDIAGNAESPELGFQASPSASPGFVQVSRKDRRFLEFSNGQAFFPIGQNLAFVGQQQYFDVDRLEPTFDKMASHGANFARIWTCCEDWALAIEARKSAFGRSWGWNPPWSLVRGREAYFGDHKCVLLEGQAGQAVAINPNYPIAVRPNTRYLFSGRASLDREAALAIKLDGQRVGDTIRAETKGRGDSFSPFRRELTTGADQYWLPRLTFELEAAGSAGLRSLSLQEAAGGPELLGELDLDRPVQGYYNPIDCYLLDRIIEAAERKGIYLQLCLLTRDLYMDLLADDTSPDYDRAIRQATKLLRYAVARWGYSTHVAAWEYFNEMNPGLPTDRFYDILGQYLEQTDVQRHLRTTSAWGPAPKDWRHPRIDVAQLHWYLRPAWGEIWKDEVAAVADRARLLRETAGNKPSLLAEFGLAGDQWQLSPHMKQDKGLVHFRRSLWASAMSGLSGATLFWWWESLDRQNAYLHYRPLAEFLKDLPLGHVHLESAEARATPAELRVVGLQAKCPAENRSGDPLSDVPAGSEPHAARNRSDTVYLWLSDSRAAWHRQVVENVAAALVPAAAIEVQNLSSGVYRVEWWDTHTGEVVKRDTVTVSSQDVRLPVPSFREAIACKLLLDPR